MQIVFTRFSQICILFKLFFVSHLSLTVHSLGRQVRPQPVPKPPPVRASCAAAAPSSVAVPPEGGGSIYKSRIERMAPQPRGGAWEGTWEGSGGDVEGTSARCVMARCGVYWPHQVHSIHSHKRTLARISQKASRAFSGSWTL